MDSVEALGLAQEHACIMLQEQFDEKRSIPMRASSHTDLWPGDRWPEAYIAADLPDMAEAAMASIARSQRPDGSFPHLMQGSHIRAGQETRWIDRQVYRLQGNGAVRLANGEWVTRSYAPPTQALSVLAISNAGLKLPETLTLDRLMDASIALYDAREDRYRQGLLVAKKRDELTNANGELANDLHEHGKVVDYAVNALAIKNAEALGELENEYGDFFTDTVSLVVEEMPFETSEQVNKRLEYLAFDNKDGDYTYMKPEEVLANARMQQEWLRLNEAQLAAFYTPPDPNDKHKERTHLSMAETIEVARLTPYSDESHAYLRRVLPKIAQLGVAGITRFEDTEPGRNAISNKAGRKQVWLPTAAQIAQIKPEDL